MANTDDITPGQIRYIEFLRARHAKLTESVLNGRHVPKLTKREASEVIDQIKTKLRDEDTDYDGEDPPGGDADSGEGHEGEGEGEGQPIYRENSARGIIEQSLANNGISEAKTKKELGKDVGKPDKHGGKLVFKQNTGEGRKPLPMPEQKKRFEQTVHDVAEAMRKKQEREQEQKGEGEGEQEQEVEVNEDVPKACHDWLQRVQEIIRPHVRERGFAEVSMRLTIAGAKLYRAMGNDPLAFKAVEHSASLAWPEESRKTLNIKEFDPLKLKKKLDPEQIDTPQVEVGAHELLPWIKTLHAAGIMVALVGPAGCGKSYLPAGLAQELGVPFGLVPMTQGASTTWLTGAFTLDGWITRPFVEIYEHGGVFLFDEMDAADPNMLLLVNNALANDQFQNPANGKILKKHEEFIPMAAMNTLGTGANRRYVGRERLDLATLDRWAAGMVSMDFDHKLERRIFESIITAENVTDKEIVTEQIVKIEKVKPSA